MIPLLLNERLRGVITPTLSCERAATAPVCPLDPTPATASPIASSWLNTEQIATCPEGSEGVSVLVPAGAIRSLVSQADADTSALAAAQALLVCISAPEVR